MALALGKLGVRQTHCPGDQHPVQAPHPPNPGATLTFHWDG